MCPSPTGHDRITGARQCERGRGRRAGGLRARRFRSPPRRPAPAAAAPRTGARTAFQAACRIWSGRRLSGRSTTVPPRRSANCQSASTSDRCKSSGLPTITTSKRDNCSACTREVDLRRGKQCRERSAALMRHAPPDRPRARDGRTRPTRRDALRRRQSGLTGGGHGEHVGAIVPQPLLPPPLRHEP